MFSNDCYPVICGIALLFPYFAQPTLDEFAANTSTDSTNFPHGMGLHHLHILFRHGDRTPISDPINTEEVYKTLWPSGRGQLTDIGILQEFELGKWLRDKYSNFIPTAYNASDFHIRSTDIDRTLMSAQAVSAGLYHNSSSPLTPFGLAWKPVPVHTVSQEADILLSTAICPSLELQRRLQMNSQVAVEYENKHRSLFDLIGKHVAVTVNRFNVWKVLDTAICMKAHNFSLPEWLTDDVLDELTDVDMFYWNLQYTSTTEIIRLEIGVFINAVIQHITAITDRRTAPIMRNHHLSDQHILAYSAHDTDVTFLLSALGAYDKQVVQYSAAVILELLGPKPPAPRHEFHLALLYKRGYKDPTGVYLPLPPCSDKPAKDGCPLDLVLEYLEPFVLREDDFVAACTASSVASRNKPSMFHSIQVVRYSGRFNHLLHIAFGIITLICILGICSLILYYRFRSRPRQIPFEELTSI